MNQLRLGRVPDPLDIENNDDPVGLFKSSGQAYQQDVVPMSRGAAPEPTPEPAQQVAAAPAAGSFKFDLYGAKEPRPAKEGVFEFDLYGNARTAAPEIKKPDDSGDTSRGFSAALNQTPALLKGAVGYLGAVGEKTLGEGGNFTALKQWGQIGRAHV